MSMVVFRHNFGVLADPLELLMPLRFIVLLIVRTALVVGVAGSFLAGCSKKPQVETEAANSQVVARVGNEVVTVQELDNEFRLGNVPNDMRKDPATIKRVVNELVTRKYLVGQALKDKIDREPTVLLDILR